MKIAFLSDTYWPRVNGVAAAIKILTDNLRKRGHEVRLFTNRYPGFEDADPKDIRRYPAYVFPFSPEDRLVGWWRRPDVVRDLAEFDPDVVHSHTEFAMRNAAKAYCGRYGKPFVLSIHTFFESYISCYIPILPVALLKAIARTVTRDSCAGVDSVVTPSNRMREVLLSYDIETPIHAVPTGVDQEHFAVRDGEAKALRIEVDAEHPVLAGKHILLFAGRVGQEKNLSLLVDVMKRVSARYPDAMLVIAGDGPYRHVFEKAIAHEGLSGRLLMLGYVERMSLRKWYAAADIFVFPSCTETQGLVIIESMLAGTPVVAIGEMGTQEVMGGDNGGFMVRNDAEEFAARVCELLGDPALKERKSAEARSHGDKWTVERLTKRLVDVYEDLVGGR